MTEHGDSGIPRRATGDVAPMSYAQELLWLLDRATPGLTAYNVPRAIRIRGTLNVAALALAIEDLVERHEILRTTYAAAAEGPVQHVHPHAAVPLHVIDLTAEPEASRDDAIERVVLADARTPFDLSRDRLLRATLVRLARDDHGLILASHHIASDGWSKGILYRELSAAYAARQKGHAPAFPPLDVQYADFASWQRDAMRDADHEAHLGFWREHLAPPLPVLDLPTVFPRPATQSFEGSRTTMMLPSALVGQLRALGMDRGATLYMVLLAAYQTVLHRYGGQDDIITGSPIAGRDQPETEDLIGYFANTLAMRTSFAGDPTFGELLERISEYAIEAYEHQDVPFEKLVLDLRDAHETSGHAPLFRCVLTMEDTIPDQLVLGDADVQPILVDYGQAKFDLTLLFAEQPDGLRLTLWHRTDLFTDAYAARFLGHVRSVLEAAVGDVGVRIWQLPLLTPEERAALHGWNDTAADEGEPATIVALLENQASRAPDSIALVSGTTLTRGQLESRANQLAHHLIARGAQPGHTVGVLMDRSAEAIVALVAVLKAGCAYMPLSVDAPPARLQVQMRESGAALILTADEHLDRLPAGSTAIVLGEKLPAIDAQSEGAPQVPVTPDSIAYVLYTSGSTGVPKGVAVTHAHVVHYARAIASVLTGRPPATALDEVAGWQFGMASTLAADLGNTSLYPALLGGGTLHVLSADMTTDSERFASRLAEYPLDVLKITPNHFMALAGSKRGAELASVMPSRWLVTGGEALRLEVARALLAAGKGRVLNHYGPTETTVGAMTFPVTDEVDRLGAQTVPVGRPLARTHAYVVDARGNEQPLDIPGELWIGGAGVAMGYLRRDDLTADRFVEHAGERVYRTGDRVRRLDDGSVEFLGRADDQVKVRGYRVEPGEIESALRAHPGVASVAVLPRTDVAGDATLVAYVVPRQAGYAVSHGDRPTVKTLAEWLAAQLPSYMVPGEIVLLDTLPLTANGKVDRVALAALSVPIADVDSSRVAPRTPTETVVARIWCDVLKRDEIGVTESFLDVGGHSLLAIRVLGRISKELGVRLPLRTLFETPTVERVAALIDAEISSRAEEVALREALAAVESMSDDEVAQRLATEREGGN